VKVIFFIIACLSLSLAGHSQTKDWTARKYYESGCEKIIRKDYQGAIGDLSRAIARDSNFIQAFENRGVAKFQLRDNRGAVEDYTYALKLNPYDYNTLGRRGWAEFYLQEYDKAIEDFSRAIEGGRNNTHYYNIRGQVKYAKKDFQGAIEDLTIVLKSWSGEKNQKRAAYYWRGMAEIKSGQKESGCLDLKKAEKLGYPEASEALQIFCLSKAQAN
jgi:tetratricopeptide (TPR) repeat protein